jgi:hypothetical protein
MRQKTKNLGSKKQDLLKSRDGLISKNSHTTNDKLITNKPICPGSNPGGAIILLSEAKLSK